MEVWTGNNRGNILSALIYNTISIILHSVLFKMRKLFLLDTSLWTMLLRVVFLEFHPDLFPGSRLNMSIHNLPSRYPLGIITWFYQAIIRGLLTSSLRLFFKSLLWPAECSWDLAPAYLTTFSRKHCVLFSSHTGFLSVCNIPQAFSCCLPLLSPQVLYMVKLVSFFRYQLKYNSSEKALLNTRKNASTSGRKESVSISTYNK